MKTITKSLWLNYLLIGAIHSQGQSLVQKADGTVPILTKGVTLGVDIVRPNASIYYLNAKPDTSKVKDTLYLKVMGIDTPAKLTADVVSERLFGTYLSVKNDDDQASTFAVFGSGNLKPQVKAGFLYGRTKDINHKLTTHVVAINKWYRDTLGILQKTIQKPARLDKFIKKQGERLDSLRFAKACLGNETTTLKDEIDKLIKSHSNADSCLAVPKSKLFTDKKKELTKIDSMLIAWEDTLQHAKRAFPNAQTDAEKALPTFRTLSDSRNAWRDTQRELAKKLLITRTYYIGANLSTSSFNYLSSPYLSQFTSSLVEDSLAIAFDVTAGLNYHIGRDLFLGLSTSPGYTNTLSALTSKSYTRKDSYKNDSLSIEKTETYNAVTGNYRRYWHIPFRADILYNIPISSGSQKDSVASVLIYAGLEYKLPTNVNVAKAVAQQANLLAGLYLFTGRKQRFIGGLQFGFQDISNNNYWLKARTDSTAERKSFGDRFTVSIVGRITLARLGGLSDFFNSLRSTN